jgi:PIN domain nuclease of toxin-antitoxin system
MKFLLDTHILLWAAYQPEKLSELTRTLLNDIENELFYSAASLWEIAIKRGLGRNDFQIQPRVLQRELQDQGYQALDISTEHSLAVEDLPLIHKDPFDRILIAQATVEGITLLSADELVIQYPGPIRKA